MLDPRLHRAVRTLRENPNVRRIAIPTYRRMARFMAFGQGSRVLINSLPKAGTHVLSTLLKLLPGMIHSGQHYVLDDFRQHEERPRIWGDIPEIDWVKLERTFASFNKGQFMTAHFAAVPKLIELLDALDYRTLFIIRDPRDVVVSSSIYMASLERHIMHGRYAEDFKTPEERIMATITGFPADDRGRGAESIGQKVDRYLPWLTSSSVHSCRFETLIGPAGGGTAEGQQREIEGIARHIGRSPTPQQIEGLAHRTWSPKSPTFRKGRIGDWRNHFTDEHKEAFKRVAGQHLIALGYENDLDW